MRPAFLVASSCVPQEHITKEDDLVQKYALFAFAGLSLGGKRPDVYVR
jgi:hypothetical protein